MTITAASLFSEFIDYFRVNSSYVMSQFFRHFLISIYGVLFAAIIAIPLGILIARKHRLSSTLIGIANVIQTVPSLAMLSIFMIGLGLGVQTVIATVALYSFLPILKNTCAGILSVPEALLDAAKGMGMTRMQRVLKVEVPLAMSVIMGGIRNALVIGIGITAVGTFIGAGGLGDIIARGVNVAGGSAIILAGAIPTAVMAIVIDLLLGQLEKRLTPGKPQKAA
ncbi:MAG TPA: ABC transporter permease [Clostridiaceae bacterium]|nr:ABC transporter permease [Clostridiaceae bacterium]